MSIQTASEDVKEFLSRQALALDDFESHKLEDFSKERACSCNSMLGWIFVQFKKLLQEGSIFGGLRNLFSGTALDETKQQFSVFQADFKRFDDLSNYYGNQYRGSFVLIYLMGSLAVLAALVPVGFSFEEHFGHEGHHYALIFTVVELFLILTILMINQVGANPHGSHAGKSILGFPLNRRWHQRWIEYRILAERFRYMEILYPIGINPLIDGSGRKADMGEWINAYFAMRLTQVKTVQADDKLAYRDRLLAVMKEQSDYHEKNAHRSEHIHHRLHTLATWLFYGTLLACASHFIWHNPILTLASGFLPALAAAMHGILANGEFSKAIDVSERMHHQIDWLIKQLHATADESKIRDIVIEFHNIVVGEALNWRTMFKDKNVPLA